MGIRYVEIYQAVATTKKDRPAGGLFGYQVCEVIQSSDRGKDGTAGGF